MGARLVWTTPRDAAPRLRPAESLVLKLSAGDLASSGVKNDLPGVGKVRRRCNSRNHSRNQSNTDRKCGVGDVAGFGTVG